MQDVFVKSLDLVPAVSSREAGRYFRATFLTSPPRAGERVRLFAAGQKQPKEGIMTSVAGEFVLDTGV